MPNGWARVANLIIASELSWEAGNQSKIHRRIRMAEQSVQTLKVSLGFGQIAPVFVQEGPVCHGSFTL
jgi:hypothetical protein